MAAIHLLALLALVGGAEEVQGQSSRRVEEGEISRAAVGRLDMRRGEGAGGNSSAVMLGRQGRASRGRQSRQSCTAKTGMSFTRYWLIKHHVITGGISSYLIDYGSLSAGFSCELFPNILNTLVYLVLSANAWTLSHKMWKNPETENNQPCLTGMCIIISASASATVHHGTIEPVCNDNFGAFFACIH